MADFLIFILSGVFILDNSKPIARTWKGFTYLIAFSAWCIAAVFGLVMLLYFKDYVKGLILLFVSVSTFILWCFIHRGFSKKR